MRREQKYDNKVIWTKIFFVLFIVLFTIVFAFKESILKYSSQFSMKIDKQNNAIGDTISQKFNYTLNKESFNLTFIEFGAKSCSACIAMDKVLTEIRNEFRREVNVVFMNVTTSQGDKYADYYKVMMIPTQVILNKDGEEVFRHTGFIDSEELKTVFKKHGLRDKKY